MCIHEIKGNLYNYHHVRDGSRVHSIYMGPVSGRKPWVKRDIGEFETGYGTGETSKRIHESPLKVDKVTLQNLRTADIKERKQMVKDISKVKDIKIPDNSVETYFNGSGEVVGQTYKGEDGSVYELPSVAPVKQREKIYTKQSAGHPAKMYTPLVQRIIQDYSEPGDIVLDPMGGIGTTGIEASRLGRNAIVVDYEKRFVNEAKKNAILLEKSGQKIGDIKVVYGDARNLGRIRNVDVVITSPPFEDSLAIIGNMSIEKQRKYGLERPSNKLQKSGYSRNLDNIGNKKEYAYIEDMKKVYSECHKSLKSKGKMIVHMKNHLKDGKIIRLDQKTKTLVESTNFKFVEKRKRHVDNPSAWTNIYRKQHPDAPQVNYEDILVFKKI